MNKKGMSLIEFVIVISIISILSLVTFPNIQTKKIDGATEMVYYDLQYARMQAISKKNDFRVLFNNETGCHVYDGHTYKIHDDRNSNGIYDSGEEIITRDIGTDFGDVVFTADMNPAFSSEGTSGICNITLTNYIETKYINLLGTGRIRISKTPS
ncbi:GspH/FimT family protein [bacterium]|nr:GspH/FimT family protein [bacterium]